MGAWAHGSVGEKPFDAETRGNTFAWVLGSVGAWEKNRLTRRLGDTETQGNRTVECISAPVHFISNKDKRDERVRPGFNLQGSTFNA